MVLTPTARWPTTLPEATQGIVLADDAAYPIPLYDIIALSSLVPTMEPIVVQLALMGHRVFVLRHAPDHLQGVSVCARGQNLFDVLLPAQATSSGEGLLEGLAQVRASFDIVTATLLTDATAHGSVADRARDRWGWKLVTYGSAANAGEHETEDSIRAVADGLDEWIKTDGRGTNWLASWHEVDSASRCSYPLVSIIFATCNNLVFPKLCIESLLANTEYPNYEIVIVDNGSTDGTDRYVRRLTEQYPHVRAVFNHENLGFARANNQGIAEARGDILLLLNTDTIVPPGWLTRLVRHLDQPEIGMVGPVTNRISNQAQIASSYHTYGELLQFARERGREYDGRTFDIPMLVMFCVALRRDVYDQIGPLDERFQVGMFEDDDYSLRIHQAGFRTVCAEDSFVHHFGEATIARVVGSAEWCNLFEANRRRYEEKWGIHWKNHSGRLNTEYQQMIDRVRQAVTALVPIDSRVLVVSKGDNALLDLNGRRAQHFPADDTGQYAGYHPVDSADAIVRLRRACGDAPHILVIPQVTSWWLEHYPEFKQYLDSTHQLIAELPDTGFIYALNWCADAHLPAGARQEGVIHAD